MGALLDTWLDKGVNVVVDASHGGFFSSPGGTIVLYAGTAIASAVGVAILHRLKKLFERLGGILHALLGEPARPEYGIPEQKGLIKQVDEVRVRQDRLEDHITEEINNLNKNLSDIRSHLKMSS